MNKSEAGNVSQALQCPNICVLPLSYCRGLWASTKTYSLVLVVQKQKAFLCTLLTLHFMSYIVIEGTARCAGLLLAPLLGLGRALVKAFFSPSVKKAFFNKFLPIFFFFNSILRKFYFYKNFTN